MTKILCLDGGGVRGTMTIELLRILERENYLGKSIFESFDIFSGVSVGSMLVCGLIIPSDNDPTKPKYNASDIKNIFMDKVKYIFERSWLQSLYSFGGLWGAKYNHQNKLNVLTSLFGDMTLSQLLKPVMIPIYDAKLNKTILITTDKHPNLKVVDLIMGSTAAPVYFDQYTFMYNNIEHVWMDGGLGLNNTSIGCLSRVLSIHPEQIKNIKILNIGTGVAYKDYSLDKSGLVHFGGDLVDIFMSATVTEDISDCKKIIGKNFMRINCIMDEKFNTTDNIADEYLNYFLDLANKWYENTKNIEKIIDWIDNQ